MKNCGKREKSVWRKKNHGLMDWTKSQKKEFIMSEEKRYVSKSRQELAELFGKNWGEAQKILDEIIQVPNIRVIEYYVDTLRMIAYLDAILKDGDMVMRDTGKVVEGRVGLTKWYSSEVSSLEGVEKSSGKKIEELKQALERLRFRSAEKSIEESEEKAQEHLNAMSPEMKALTEEQVLFNAMLTRHNQRVDEQRTKDER